MKRSRSRSPQDQSAKKAVKGAGTTTMRRSGRGITNGFADALRTTPASYKPTGGYVSPPPMAQITRQAICSMKNNTFLPLRDSNTKELTFSDFPAFRPNLTPDEVIKLGSFGGTYFRSIYSAPAEKEFSGEEVYKELPWKEWGWVDGQIIEFDEPNLAVATNLRGKTVKKPISSVKSPRNSSAPMAGEKFDSAIMLTSTEYRTSINRFGVKCGGSLDMWESSGWINAQDPYGWFQWYCWFYLGRRSTDDTRQIARWAASAGPKGRFRNQLLNKCLSFKTEVTDATVSPVIRQTLQHWGLEIRKVDSIKKD